MGKYLFPFSDTCTNSGRKWKTTHGKLTCSCRAYYIFAGLFSVIICKKFLAIKNVSVNETMSGQPNKCFIH